MDKQKIINEIQRTAKENGGKPLGKLKFSRLTGINEWYWSGIYWTKWNDAYSEAGFTPNTMQKAYKDEHFLNLYADLTTELGRVPTNAELRIKAKNEINFPFQIKYLNWKLISPTVKQQNRAGHLSAA